MSENQRDSVKAGEVRQERMVPLLSRRALSWLGVGLGLGLALGFLYWAYSPSIAALSAAAASQTRLFGQSAGGPYSSTATVQVVSTGSSYMNLQELRRRGEYYAAKANTYPFFEFLSGELAMTMPEQPLTVQDLRGIVRIRYDYDNDVPTIKVETVGNTERETYLLAFLVPDAFRQYLISEEAVLRSDDAELIRTQIKAVQTDLLQVKKTAADFRAELNAALAPKAPDVTDNANRLALSAEIRGLQTQLDLTAVELAALTAIGEAGAPYTQAKTSLEWTSLALSHAEAKLFALNTAQPNPDTAALQEKYDAAMSEADVLNKRLTDLNDELWRMMGPSADRIDVALASADPSAPVPVPTERVQGRQALMIGAILGMGLAWVLLNLRWILRSLSEQTGRREEGGESAP